MLFVAQFVRGEPINSTAAATDTVDAGDSGQRDVCTLTNAAYAVCALWAAWAAWAACAALGAWPMRPEWHCNLSGCCTGNVMFN